MRCCETNKEMSSLYFGLYAFCQFEARVPEFEAVYSAHSCTGKEGVEDGWMYYYVQLKKSTQSHVGTINIVVLILCIPYFFLLTSSIKCTLLYSSYELRPSTQRHHTTELVQPQFLDL